jgi:hypothetical protein
MDQCFYIRVSRQSQSIHINIEMRSYNSGNSSSNSTRKTSATATPFCKVCCDAGLPADKYNSHYVKDQPGPNGKVVCPTLLSQRCLICGVPGHTTRYCPENPDNSSTTSSSSTVSVQIPRYALATDEVRLPLVQQRAERAIPRIVYQNSTIETKKEKTEFPALPGKFNASIRFHNDEPLHKRGPASPVQASPFQASPVHSPAEQKFTRVKYNKRNNPFGALQNYQVDSEDEEPKQQQKQQKPQQLPPISASSLSSWASVAATTKTTATTVTTTSIKQQQQRSRSRFSIVVPTAISAPPLPPIAFKAKPTTKSAAPTTDSKQVKKLWGDTDSEDDEEFLQRGLVQ